MSQFCDEVVKISGLVPGDCRPGLQALNPADRQRVICQDTRSLEGSICLDDALKKMYPQAPRWDYGVGLEKEQKVLAIWVEVHPARSGGDVQSLLAKAHWLKARLQESPKLQSMTQKPFHWVASGTVKIPKTGSWRRQLSQNGIRFPRQRLRLP